MIPRAPPEKSWLASLQQNKNTNSLFSDKSNNFHTVPEQFFLVARRQNIIKRAMTVTEALSINAPNAFCHSSKAEVM